MAIPGGAAASMPEDLIRKELCAALDGIESAGTFASFGHLADLPDPQLQVDPCGNIHFPLPEVDASRIIAASHQAPFGKGTETIVDTSVRRTWELNQDQITIHNAQFQDAILRILPIACRGLGILEHGNVEAQLYKLLLYEKGALFKPHTEYAAPSRHPLFCY